MECATWLSVAKVFSVRSAVAPVGNCTVVIIKPWSSLGINELGKRVINTNAPAPNAK